MSKTATMPRFESRLTATNQGDYACIIGRVLGIQIMSQTDPHLYLNLDVDGREPFVAAINKLATDNNRLQYAVRCTELDPRDVPYPGIHRDAQLSYKEMQLRDRDFTAATDQSLTTMLCDLARRCEVAAVYGYAHSNPDRARAIHDVHQNSGQNGKNQNHCDGAIGFVFQPPQMRPYVQWVFLKFATQTLNR